MLATLTSQLTHDLQPTTNKTADNIYVTHRSVELLLSPCPKHSPSAGSVYAAFDATQECP